jgi:hypothetical protein
MKAFRKVTSGELLRKQPMSKNYYVKNTCIFTPFNVVTSRFEALVLGNKYFYAFVKEVCRLRAQTRFYSSINPAAMLKRCDLNHFFSWVNRWQSLGARSGL